MTPLKGGSYFVVIYTLTDIVPNLYNFFLQAEQEEF